MENRVHVGRSGWQTEEIEQLREAVRRAGSSGEPLRGVFEEIGQNLGRKPNSVRNFYYASMKREEEGNVPHADPFQTFTQEEIRALVRQVLLAKGKGISVRSCVQQLSMGDRKLMLRYQNKYRSVLKNRPQLVREIMAELEAEGETPHNPYAIRGEAAEPLYQKVSQRLSQSGDAALLDLLRGLDGLLKRLDVKKQESPLEETVRSFVSLPKKEQISVLDDFCQAALEKLQSVPGGMGQ